MAGFGDIWGAVEEGQNAGQQNINNYFHDQAMNAITQTYGPMLGDPQAALQAQNFNYLQAQNPQLLRYQQLQNQNQELVNQRYGGETPSIIQNSQGVANQNTAAGAVAGATIAPAIAAKTATDTATAENAGPQAAAATMSAQGQANTTGVQGDLARGLQLTAGATAFARASSAALAANPNDIAGAWNAGKQAMVQSGFPPAAVDQYAAEHQAGFFQDPNREIDKVNMVAGAANLAQYARMTPAQAAELGLTQQKLQGEASQNLSTVQGIYQKTQDREDQMYQSAGTVGAAAQGVRDANSAVDQMTALLPKLPTNGLAREAEAHIPGSPTAQFIALGEQVHAGLALDRMQALKEAGGTGSGIRSTKEFQAAGDAFAQLDPTALNPAALQTQLANAKAHLQIASNEASNAMTRTNAQYPAAVADRQQAQAVYQTALSNMRGANNFQGTGATPALPGQAPAAGASAPPSSPAAPPSGSPPAGGAAGGPARPNGGASGSWEAPGAASTVEATAPEAPAGAVSGAGARFATGFLKNRTDDSYPMPHAAGVDMDNLKPGWRDTVLQLQRDAAAQGIQTKVVSGYRDNDLQAKLYANYQARRQGQPLPYPQQGAGGIAAPPGASYHNYGEAVDIITTDPSKQAALTALARNPKYGIKVGADFGDYDHYEQGTYPQGQYPGAANAPHAKVAGGAPAASPRQASPAPAQPQQQASAFPAPASPLVAQQGQPSGAAPPPAQVINPAPQPVQNTLGQGNAGPNAQRVQPQPVPQTAPAQRTASSSGPGVQIQNGEVAGRAAAASEAATATQKLGRTPDKVMDGRALLAKYLGRPGGSV